ncbi:MAG: hypothetical protein AB7U29_07905 [Desulfobulbus sp.]
MVITLRKELMERLAAIEAAGNLPEDFLGQYLALVVEVWKTVGGDIILRGAALLKPFLALFRTPTSLWPHSNWQAASHGVGTLWDGPFMMALAICPDLVEQLGIPSDHTIGYAMLFGKPAVEYHRITKRGPAKVNYLG